MKSTTIEEVEMSDSLIKSKIYDESSILSEIKYNIHLLEQAVEQFEPYLISKVLRTTLSLRKHWNVEILKKIIKSVYFQKEKTLNYLLNVIETEPNNMDLVDFKEKDKDILPEVDIYIHLIIQFYLLDTKEYEKGAIFSQQLIEKLKTFNRRSMDKISAKVYFYYSYFFEIQGKLSEIRPIILTTQRTATLRHDNETTSMTIILLLRNYLHYNLYNQADRLVSKITFPESASNNLIVRYLYYLGRIRAIQLDYTSAHSHLVGAIRKAPQGTTAAGFLQAAHKLNIIVDLLMGGIPERSIFRQPMLEKALIPYLQIVQAVRKGDITLFTDAFNKHGNKFHLDGTSSLILRLHQNVLRTGIRMMSISYSRISLRDICLKLHLDSEESAEYMVAKAIRDGVIEASLEHEKGYMQSKEILDIYSTHEPQIAFHDRILFCLNLHASNIKAMRFPMNTHKLEIENAEFARKRIENQIVEAEEDFLD
ncbi:proteasome regulatory particle lid subunit RPN3 [Pneumocystis jirovecii RU7]|uniref:PCI domain-containing protein n=1 Tax=Pneumocystis jirovecii (strain RU7) TaxID=1408657 RepID=A0A0W4ZRQ7_PNEJ7|nr:proteasome regulatory particle lid subunit RPN3 [Pneumocystis jirovecii RU7]KTW31042.1 hypothetical protein T551_01594 [Pneumocystis jirovecii RU7]